MPSELTTADRMLYRIIADAVVAEEMTPTMVVLRSAMEQLGYPMSRDRLGDAVRRLDEAGLIRRKRIGSLRVYLLPGSNRHTKPCKEFQTKTSSQTAKPWSQPVGGSDWPRPTAASIAAYEAAMARQPYASVSRALQPIDVRARRDLPGAITMLTAIPWRK